MQHSCTTVDSPHGASRELSSHIKKITSHTGITLKIQGKTRSTFDTSDSDESQREIEREIERERERGRREGGGGCIDRITTFECVMAMCG